jgi:hypothetical protein|tara:strand:+ start:864 stop:998 length:135 start_codon:yes stop_codon:yes gene_type:complete
MNRILIAGKIHPKGLAILEAEDGLEIEMITETGFQPEDIARSWT